jgi:hypothetical protein
MFAPHSAVGEKFMGSVQSMMWAMGLKRLHPAAKLMAIYIGSRQGMSRFVSVPVEDAAEFCGIRATPNEVQRCLEGIPNITFTRTAPREFMVDGIDVFKDTIEP